MSTFVLVHGAWHGGWVWYKIAGLLRQQGHTVHTPDLPGHDGGTMPLAQITLKAYVDRLAEVINQCSEPVVLVGHSMGGVVISQTAEQCSERISALVYVCAFLLQDGECLLQWAEADKEALVPGNLVFSEDKTSVTLRAEAISEALYGDCNPEVIDLAIKLLVPQATAPLATAVHLTAEKFGRVPRIYVECLRDRAISLAIQREMYKAAGGSQVFTLDCDHSPMSSMPEELTKCLLAALQIRQPAAGTV